MLMEMRVAEMRIRLRKWFLIDTSLIVIGLRLFRNGSPQQYAQDAL